MNCEIINSMHKVLKNGISFVFLPDRKMYEQQDTVRKVMIGIFIPYGLDLPRINGDSFNE